MTSFLEATRVLIVEDDATVAEVLTRYLRRAGFAVAIESDGLRGLSRALADLPHLIILDRMLPGISGEEVCRRVRRAAPIPVIILSALGEELDRVGGLEIGADDYVTKPFSPREVTARVKAVLRRSGSVAAYSDEVGNRVRAGDIEIDTVTRQVTVGGCPTLLTLKEFELLSYLMRHPRRAFRRAELLEAVWGYRYGDSSTVTVHVRWLRKKVEPDPSQPRHLQTVWGVGYRFMP